MLMATNIFTSNKTLFPDVQESYIQSIYVQESYLDDGSGTTTYEYFNAVPCSSLLTQDDDRYVILEEY
jgi:hypothetical protein